MYCDSHIYFHGAGWSGWTGCQLQPIPKPVCEEYDSLSDMVAFGVALRWLHFPESANVRKSGVDWHFIYVWRGPGWL